MQETTKAVETEQATAKGNANQEVSAPESTNEESKSERNDAQAELPLEQKEQEAPQVTEQVVVDEASKAEPAKESDEPKVETVEAKQPKQESKEPIVQAEKASTKPKRSYKGKASSPMAKPETKHEMKELPVLAFSNEDRTSCAVSGKSAQVADVKNHSSSGPVKATL